MMKLFTSLLLALTLITTVRAHQPLEDGLPVGLPAFPIEQIADAVHHMFPVGAADLAFIRANVEALGQELVMVIEKDQTAHNKEVIACVSNALQRAQACVRAENAHGAFCADIKVTFEKMMALAAQRLPASECPLLHRGFLRFQSMFMKVTEQLLVVVQERMQQLERTEAQKTALCARLQQFHDAAIAFMQASAAWEQDPSYKALQKECVMLAVKVLKDDKLFRALEAYAAQSQDANPLVRAFEAVTAYQAAHATPPASVMLLLGKVAQLQEFQMAAMEEPMLKLAESIASLAPVGMIE